MPDPSDGFTVIALSPLTHSITGFSLGTQRLEPGERLPEHHHPRHDELFFIWSGEGTAHLDGAAHRLAPGTALFAGRNVAHTFLNEGDTPLVFIWVFFPDGLEYVLDALGTRREPGTPRPVPCPRPTTPHPISSQITVRGLRG
jgi:quercetin dioxygenase-like cupin family protein